MSRLKTLLTELPPFLMLADAKHVVRPVCRWLVLDGELDADRYALVQRGDRLHIHRLYEGNVPDPEPVLSELRCTVAEIAERLSSRGRDRLQILAEVAAAQAFDLAERLGLDPVVELGGTKTVASPIRLSDTPVSYRLPPPTLPG